jgi:proline dehydrogenase
VEKRKEINIDILKMLPEKQHLSHLDFVVQMLAESKQRQ